MFTHIMVPLDLAEKESSGKSISIAADLARHYNAKVSLISVTGGINGKVSYSTTEYRRRLSEFARAIASLEKIEIDSHVYDVPDPSVEVDKKLIQAVADHKIDLIVMATHQPGWVEYFVNSHAGRLASHASVSVFVVREDANDPDP